MSKPVKVVEDAQTNGLIQRGGVSALAARLGVDPTKAFVKALTQVAFGDSDITNEQLMALVIVANQYKLNPFTRELYAFPDKRSGGIIPIVSVDGWFRIINEHPEFDGFEYKTGDDEGELYGECTIYRKDRNHPCTIREYLNEVKRNTDPWKQHKQRMLRHKTIIQTARVAFGFAGIYEPDEGERILEARTVSVPAERAATGAEKAAAALGLMQRQDEEHDQAVVRQDDRAIADETAEPPDDEFDDQLPL